VVFQTKIDKKTPAIAKIKEITQSSPKESIPGITIKKIKN
jgi:hypothetical protein